MRILITGICGFVGSELAKAISESSGSMEIHGIDNFSRSGSWLNRDPLIAMGVKVIHGDIRHASDLEAIGPFDWIIDCAANASVLAGVDGKSSSRQLIENNLGGTINLLEACKRWNAGFTLLSTSRVYSIPGLAGLEMDVQTTPAGTRFTPNPDQAFPTGITPAGVAESYSTLPPVSLYGSTKVTSEHLALEYGSTYHFPVWINRCGVMAGAGQFGHPAQGIFAFWIHAFREGKPLQTIGFDGHGRQVRDCLHPRDLPHLLKQQFAEPLETNKPRIVNVAGGLANSMSLAELSGWCQQRFPDSATQISTNPENRPFDIPWMILDPTLAANTWNWHPQTTIHQTCEEIATFAESHPHWLQTSA
jgi:CDP-paratose 2-epimerase